MSNEINTHFYIMFPTLVGRGAVCKTVVSWFDSNRKLHFYKKVYNMALKQEINRIKKELANIGFQATLGKTLNELIQEITLNTK